MSIPTAIGTVFPYLDAETSSLRQEARLTRRRQEISASLRGNSRSQTKRSRLWRRLCRSGVKPRLEKGIKAFEHFFFNASNVRETAPTGEVGVLTSAFKLRDEFLHQFAPVSVLLPEMPLADLRRFSLPVFGSESHCRNVTEITSQWK